MKNNRAGLLALLVLGVATLLMVFFVLPRITDNGKPIGEAINDAGNAVKNSVEMGNEKAGDLLSDAAEETANVADKVGRLAASATETIKELTGQFSDNKVPTNEEFAAARTKVVTSLRELANVEIPESLDDTTSRLITTARSAAERTTAFLRDLPTDAAAAASQIRRLGGVFAGTDDGAPEPVQPPAPASTDDTAQLPVFDVLRVEPDGSAVIAGKAKPGSKLEIVNNGVVISQATIDPSGDFAAVLDNPLPPGDHQLVLRTTEPDGKVTQSDETATVSVPANRNGELLAMVSKPGKASRLMATPSSETAQPASAQPTVPEAAAPAPAGSTEIASQPPVVSTTTPAAPAADASTAPAASEAAAIQVTAVEFEGDKIFVAGNATGGSTVRAFVDDKEIGSSTTQSSGSFVIEGTVDLSVGNHTIRAEMLDANGQVAVRVNVPFSRPASDQATVAMQLAPSGVAATSPASSENPSTVSDRATFENLRSGVSKAFSILTGLYKDGAQPRIDEMAAARSATSIALGSLSEFRPAPATDAAFAAFTNGITIKAKELLAVIDALPRDVTAVGNAIAGLTSRMAELNGAAPTAPETGGPRTYEQAPLAHNNGAVIIRRGDTLWQISRRVYGQGVRYTTIYLANQEQINNPDLIEPGQIFGVPENALPNAEELHRKRLTGG